MAPRGLFRMVTLLTCSSICTVLWAAGCGSGGGAGIGLSKSTAFTVGVGASAAQPLTCTSTSYVPNYAGENDPLSGLHNRLYHWNKQVLSIYFVPSALGTPTRVAQAQQGFSWWVTTTNIGSFQIVTDPTKADITVMYANCGETAYGAVTNYNTDANGILQSATITFNMTYLSTVANIEPVAAHEFGHAIGIGGHSNDAGDLMDANASVYSDTGLNTRDVNTIMTAYCGGSNTGSSNVSQKAVPLSGGVSSGQITCALGVHD